MGLTALICEIPELRTEALLGGLFRDPKRGADRGPWRAISPRDRDETAELLLSLRNRVSRDAQLREVRHQIPK